jgi:hypothetical protein
LIKLNHTPPGGQCGVWLPLDANISVNGMAHRNCVQNFRAGKKQTAKHSDRCEIISCTCGSNEVFDETNNDAPRPEWQSIAHHISCTQSVCSFHVAPGTDF